MLETGAGVEEQEGHWEQCENEEKEEGQTGIGKMLSAKVRHASLDKGREGGPLEAIAVEENSGQEDVN